MTRAFSSIQQGEPAAISRPTMSRWKLLGVVIPCLAFAFGIFAYYCWHGLTLGYSYWLDELFSVVTSSEGIGRAIEFTFKDVHPPLYQIVLTFWINIFGDSESATRLLSMVFAVASIGVLASLPRSIVPLRTLALMIAFYISNASFTFYAQETRSYAMLMLFSCMALNGIVRGSIPTMLASALLLGATHFFGTLLAVLLLAYTQFRFPTRRTLPLSLIVGAVVVSWPVAQMLFARAGDLLGGEFWIKAGAKESVVQAALTLWPPLYTFFASVFSVLALDRGLFIAMSMAAFLLTLTLALRRKAASGDRTGEWNAITSISAFVVLFVILVAGLSLHTPISTARNYTVLIPFSALILAVVASRSLDEPGIIGVLAALGCLAYTGASLQMTVDRMERKIASENSLRDRITIAVNMAKDEQIEMYHLSGDGPWTNLIYNYYTPDNVQISTVPEQADLPDRFELIYILESCDRIARFLGPLSKDYNPEFIEGQIPNDCSYANGVALIRIR